MVSRTARQMVVASIEPEAKEADASTAAPCPGFVSTSDRDSAASAAISALGGGSGVFQYWHVHLIVAELIARARDASPNTAARRSACSAASLGTDGMEPTRRYDW